MTGEPGRARRWRDEGTVTVAVLTVVFVAVLGWGVAAGWDTGSLAFLAVGAVLLAVLTVRALRRPRSR